MTTAASAPARKPRRQGWLRRHWNGLSRRGKWVVAGTPALLFLLLVVVSGIVYAKTDIPLPQDVVREQTALVTYADGSPLGSIQGEENRTDIPLAQVPEHVQKAVLAAEDKGFYGHSGVSPTGIARAAFRNLLRRGGSKQGGSTITQQYVKGAFLSRERTLSRKFKEVVIAVKLDRKYSKDEILEFYLNTVYFGRGAYGIEAAAKTYFNKPAKALTLPEGALLATLIRSPEAGDPAKNPKIAEKRFEAVLDNMVEAGTLDEKDRDAQKFPRTATRNAKAARERIGGQKGFIFEQVESELEARGFDLSKLYTGVRIKTTLTRKAQDASQKAVDSVLPATEVPAELRTALIAVEPGSGKIRAMYGGRDYVARQFNYALQARRQPGSSFKPYVLAAALEDGIGLKSRYDGNSPQEFGGDDYEVTNFDEHDYGTVDLVDATAKSVNTVYVALAEDVGIKQIKDVAHRAGIPEKAPLPDDLTIALGSGGLTPLDQASSFATFAAQGTRAQSYLVEEVVDAGGRKVYEAKPEKEEGAIEKDVSADVTYAMTKVLENGTARASALAGGRPAAGKTGTTQDSTDAWFVGYTPQLSAAVWMGFDDEKRKLVGIKGRTVTGGTFPAPIWKAFMDAALDGEEVKAFPEPEFVGKAENPAPSRSASASASASASPSPSLTPSEVPSEVPSVEPSTAVPTNGGKPSKTKNPDPTPSPEPTTEPSTQPSSSPSGGGASPQGSQPPPP
jgi:1A family penicillin-binding protein